jgi:hypothetical protein
LDRTMAAARRGATPDQLAELNIVERENRYQLAIHRREGTLYFECRAKEALYSKRNGKPTRVSRIRQSIAKHGTVEALRRFIAKRDSTGLRILVENDRLECPFEQIVLDLPDIFHEGDTLIIAAQTLKREQNAQGA